MRTLASAPGKVVLLGEYVVLDGAQALVMAVDRRCTASLTALSGDHSTLTSRMPDATVTEFGTGDSSGSALVDVLRNSGHLAPPWAAWSGEIDSSEFFVGRQKLGLGSSAAALVAFAGASWKAAKKPGYPGLDRLIQCHRAFQGGVGSGIDVAASLTGGCLEFRLNEAREAGIGSVRLPKSVGFAGIFAGGSASTPDLVGRYRQWAASASAGASALKHRLIAVAAEGCAAAVAGSGEDFIGAIEAYGNCLRDLGEAMGAGIVTAAHARIAELAAKTGLAYKVSGAGGGDVGIACGLDRDALRAFSAKASDEGFRVVPLETDEMGLNVEEQAE